MLSPYAFYQFWLRVEDVDVVRLENYFKEAASQLKERVLNTAHRLRPW